MCWNRFNRHNVWIWSWVSRFNVYPFFIHSEYNLLFVRFFKLVYGLPVLINFFKRTVWIKTFFEKLLIKVSEWVLIKDRLTHFTFELKWKLIWKLWRIKFVHWRDIWVYSSHIQILRSLRIFMNLVSKRFRRPNKSLKFWKVIWRYCRNLWYHNNSWFSINQFLFYLMLLLFWNTYRFNIFIKL